MLEITQADCLSRGQKQIATVVAMATVKEIRRENLAELLREFALNQAEMARRLEVEPAYVSALVTGDRNIGDRTARKIEGKFNKHLGWMDVPRAGTFSLHEPNVETFRPPRALLPLISWVAAGNRAEVNDPYAPGAAEAWIEFDTVASKSAFCLRVRGESMVRPDGTGFPDGCLVAVEPKRKAKSGDFVVVRFTDSDEATFKQYFIEGQLKYLKPLNHAYPNQIVPPDAYMVGVVFEKRIIEKF